MNIVFNQTGDNNTQIGCVNSRFNGFTDLEKVVLRAAFITSEVNWGNFVCADSTLGDPNERKKVLIGLHDELHLAMFKKEDKEDGLQ